MLYYDYYIYYYTCLPDIDFTFAWHFLLLHKLMYPTENNHCIYTQQHWQKVSGSDRDDIPSWSQHLSSDRTNMKKIIDKGEDVKSESTRVGGDKTRVQEYRLKMAMCMEWK